MKEAMVVDLPKEVMEVHQMLKEGLAVNSGYKFTAGSLHGIVEELPKYDSTVIENCLGDFGIRLCEFIQNVDIQHPNLATALNGLMTSRVASQMVDALRVATYAKEIGADSLLRLIRVTINDKKIVKECMASVLAAPPIRFLKSRSDRDYVREHGVYRMFDQKQSVLKPKKNPLAYSDVKLVVKGDAFWKEQPTTFKVHVRCNNFNEKEITRLSGIQSYMAACSLTSIANAFGTRVLALQRLGTEQYCGFHRVGVTNAATILAKLHNYRVDLNYEKIVLAEQMNKRLAIALACLLVPNSQLLSIFRSYFSAYCVKADDTVTDSVYEVLHKIAVNEHGKPAMLDADGIVLRYLRRMPSRFFFVYQPRMYPIQALKDIVPASIWRLLDQLEEHDELQGRPLFDSYHVIVPSIELDNSSFYNATKLRYHFRNGGDLYDFDTKDKAYKFLDSQLIQNRFIYPVVVGQCDDKYYFITYLTQPEA